MSIEVTSYYSLPICCILFHKIEGSVGGIIYVEKSELVIAMP